MREIQFRAWDRDRSKMIYKFRDRLAGKQYVLFWDSDNERLYCGNYMDNGDWQEPELMQYTGLKDKNGKEIYEGDICKILYTDWPSKLNSDPRTIEQYIDDIARVGVIEYCDDGFYFKTTYRTGEPNYSHINPGAHGFVKVIGNIYENPELLKTA